MSRRTISISDFFASHTSPVIRFLILGDLLFYAATGLLGPIFALFVVGYIHGGSAEVAGIAMAIFLVTRSIVQIPAGKLVDSIYGDEDDFWFMFVGLLVAGLVPLMYLFITEPIELYVVQFVYGLALAFNFPSFYALFTKYIPESKEGTAWSIYQTSIDFASAIAAAVGGILATVIGFQAVIVGVSILGVLSALALIPIYKRLQTHRRSI
jgi:MFS transporter, DHA1 family, staphyloferrin B biosynthesis exporter